MRTWPSRTGSDGCGWRPRLPRTWFAASLDDRFPDQLRDVEDEVRLRLLGVGRVADLADADAYGIVEPPVWLSVTGVEDRPDDLTAPGRIRAPISVELEHDR